jgi:hypothetical protein
MSVGGSRIGQGFGFGVGLGNCREGHSGATSVFSLLGVWLFWVSGSVFCWESEFGLGFDLGLLGSVFCSQGVFR